MNKTTVGCYALGLFSLAIFVSAAPSKRMSKEDEPPVPKEAVAVLTPTQDSHVAGVITLTANGDSVQIKGKITHLKPGKHGFHIHEFGDLRDPKGESAGPHFNPTGDSHGAPDSSAHHAGDLGNIVADKDGVAQVDIKASGLKLHFVLGRSIVIHAKPDDLKSDPSGESGERVAVAVIGLAQTK